MSKSSAQLSLKSSNSLQKAKLVTVTKKELSESTLSKLILCYPLSTSIESYRQDQDRRLHLYCDHHQGNWPNKTWKIGRFLRAYQTGKILEVIRFQFTWESVQMEGHFNTTQWMNLLPILLTRCMWLKGRQKYKLKKGPRFRKAFSTKITWRSKKTWDEQLNKQDKKWRRSKKMSMSQTLNKRTTKNERNSGTTAREKSREKTGWRRSGLRERSR